MNEQALTHESLTDALCAAIEAQNIGLARNNYPSVSQYAYAAGMRDAYLKVLRTIGEEYVPNVTEALVRLATITPDTPRRTGYVGMRPVAAAPGEYVEPIVPVNPTAVMAEIMESLS